MKLIPKLLTVWFFETLSEDFLLGLAVIAMLGVRGYGVGQRLAFLMWAIAFAMFTTGYLLTTLLARALWTVNKLWLYPSAAAILFLVHFQIMNWEMGGEWEPQIKIRIRVVGVCIVFACTLLGSLALRKWTRGTGKEGTGESARSLA